MKISNITSYISHIRSHDGFKRYFANTSWMMGEKVIRMVVALFVGVYVARYLGPERFGLLSYATSFVGLFSALATLGLDGIVICNLVQNIEDRDRLLGTAFTLKLAGGMLLFGCVSFAVQFTSSDAYTKMLVLIIAGGMILQSFQVVDFYFQSRVLGRLTSIAGLWALFVSSVTKLVLIFFQASLIWFALATVLEAGTLGVMLLFFYMKQRIRISRWRFEWSIAKDLLRDSWPLILSALSASIYMRIDQIMIKELIDDKSVGIYSVAVRLSEAWYFIPTVISMSLFPAIINAKEKSISCYRERLQKIYDLMVWIAITIALPTTFLSEYIVKFLFGKAYSDSARILAIHIWTGVFVFVSTVNRKWFLIEKLQIYSFYRTLIGAALNIFLNLILLQKLGIIGAAISTFFSWFVSDYLSMVFFVHSRKNFWLITNSFNLFIVKKRIFKF